MTAGKLFICHQLTNRNAGLDIVGQKHPYTLPMHPPTALRMCWEVYRLCRREFCWDLRHKRAMTHLVVWFGGVLRDKQPPTSQHKHTYITLLASRWRLWSRCVCCKALWPRHHFVIFPPPSDSKKCWKKENSNGRERWMETVLLSLRRPIWVWPRKC